MCVYIYIYTWILGYNMFQPTKHWCFLSNHGAESPSLRSRRHAPADALDFGGEHPQSHHRKTMLLNIVLSAKIYYHLLSRHHLNIPLIIIYHWGPGWTLLWIKQLGNRTCDVPPASSPPLAIKLRDSSQFSWTRPTKWGPQMIAKLLQRTTISLWWFMIYDTYMILTTSYQSIHGFHAYS